MHTEKLIQIGKLLLNILMFATGIFLVIWLVKYLVKKSPGKEAIEAATDEIVKRKEEKKVFTGSQFDYKALAEKFAKLLHWKHSVGGATYDEAVQLLIQIKTYGDYLEVFKAYGERAHAIGGLHVGNLDYGFEDQATEAANIFYKAYVKRLKENDK